MFRRAQILVLVTVGVLVLTLLNLPPSVAARLKLACGAVFLPLFGLARGGASFMDHASYAPLPRSALIAEVERLREENDRLKLESIHASEALAENTRLRAQLGAPPRGAWNRRLARVVAREPSAWWRSVTIDYGTRDGAAVSPHAGKPSNKLGNYENTSFHNRARRSCNLSHAGCACTRGHLLENAARPEQPEGRLEAPARRPP